MPHYSLIEADENFNRHMVVVGKADAGMSFVKVLANVPSEDSDSESAMATRDFAVAGGSQ